MLVLATVTGNQQAFAEEKAPVEDAEPFDIRSVNTFAGAFLAARTADVDRDFAAATELYRTALRFEPGNNDVKQRLMITLLMSGKFDEGAKIAEELKSDPAVERITTVVRAIEAIRKREYRNAQKLLNYDGPNDLDRLMSSLLSAWAKFGQGRPKEALAQIKNLDGPEWFRIFRNYHAGAIALAAGAVTAVAFELVSNLSSAVWQLERKTAATMKTRALRITQPPRRMMIFCCRQPTPETRIALSIA